MTHIRPFSDQEIRERAQVLGAALAESGLDAAVLTSYTAIYYYTGVPIHQFGRPAAAVLDADGGVTLICNILEKVHVDSQATADAIVYYSDHNHDSGYTAPRDPRTSVVELTAEAVRQRAPGTARVGVEENDLSLHTWRRLQAALPGVSLEPAERLAERPRLTLSPAELALVRAADEICDRGQQYLLDHMRPGSGAEEISESCRAAMLDLTLAEHADKPFYFHHNAGLGDARKRAGSSEWYTWNRQGRAERGMVLDTIFDCFLWGYWGNVERTVVVGAPAPEVGRAFSAMVDANEAAIDFIRPGVTMAEVDRVCKDVFAAAGYENSHFGTGMGRGIVSYEGGHRVLPLDVRLYNELVLEEGMAFSVEPMLGVFGLGSFRHCNTVIVTSRGCEVDSSVRRDLIVVE
ncbi:Xaa-Pro peptidase family protein [Streptosporangium sp. NPDC051022]|uniref:M24 family metallopeptidase n=1 Tax=Streptosporangium sp. NPDC051022 TaxID=3155752 RepID=UPI00343EEA5D